MLLTNIAEYVALEVESSLRLAQPTTDLEGVGNVADTRFGSEEAEMKCLVRCATNGAGSP